MPRKIVKVISWNLLRLTGATVKDIAALIEGYHPDLLLMQEATEDVATLPTIVGGYFVHEQLQRRVYGLAAWTRHPLTRAYALPLPVSSMPGRVPPRAAQIVCFRGITFANVHLSHGQFLNRWQLTRIARTIEGPAVVVGDYNAVGPTKLSGFKDVGPRTSTHIAGKIIPFRLDRCMVRGVECTEARVLQRGPSDHHPIILNLNFLSSAMQTAGVHFSADERQRELRVEGCYQSRSRPPNDRHSCQPLADKLRR